MKPKVYIVFRDYDYVSENLPEQDAFVSPLLQES